MAFTPVENYTYQPGVGGAPDWMFNAGADPNSMFAAGPGQQWQWNPHSDAEPGTMSPNWQLYNSNTGYVPGGHGIHQGFGWTDTWRPATEIVGGTLAAGYGFGGFGGEEASAGTGFGGFTAEGEGGNAAYFGGGDPFGAGTEVVGNAGQFGSTDPELSGFSGTDLSAFSSSATSSSAFPSLSQVGSSMSIGSSLYGLYLADQARRERQRQVRQRQAYQEQLNDLMAHPERVSQLPGYQFRLDQGSQAVARRMAASGYGARSGNLGTALTKYGQDYATGELQRQEGLIAQLYGMSGPDTNVRDPYEMAGRSLASLGYGVGRL